MWCCARTKKRSFCRTSRFIKALARKPNIPATGVGTVLRIIIYWRDIGCIWMAVPMCPVSLCGRCVARFFF